VYPPNGNTGNGGTPTIESSPRKFALTLQNSGEDNNDLTIYAIAH
jgi:hypothetical protein